MISPFPRIVRLCCLALLLGGLSLPTAALAADEFSFDLDEFEKKPLSWGGYAELKGEAIALNQDGAFSVLNGSSERRDLSRLTGSLYLDGNYHQGMFDFNWLLQAYSAVDQLDDASDVNVFSAWASIKPTPSVTFELGKKPFKWGKGYAWNPVGFISRPKDPNNPDDALEGYVAGAVDLVKSFSGELQTLALTTVLLPVADEINEDFGQRDHVNLAAKLYALYFDTDIDLVYFSGDSRSTRYGLDFSKNLATNFEIHGELAHIPKQTLKRLNADGTLEVGEQAVTSYLLGLRYLTANDITAIVEYYHNDAGYTEEELAQFYRLVDELPLPQSSAIAQSGYGKAQAGRDYLYLRLTQKEPFDWLYFTPGFTTIVNLNDDSFSISPEAVYTGFTNWELRLRYAHLQGERYSEYGEKANEDKLELRVRYYF